MSMGQLTIVFHLQALVKVYTEALMEYTPEGKLPVYLASGLLEYLDRASFDALVHPLVHLGATNAIHLKEDYIDRRVLSGGRLLVYVNQAMSRQKMQQCLCIWAACPDTALHSMEIRSVSSACLNNR